MLVIFHEFYYNSQDGGHLVMVFQPPAVCYWLSSNYIHASANARSTERCCYLHLTVIRTIHLSQLRKFIVDKIRENVLLL